MKKRILSFLLTVCILLIMVPTTALAANATVTLLSITDAIAPVNGGTPAALIAETEQYTGTVSWDGAPAAFIPSQPYTATITLTAKPGYTFEGVAENAFTVPCATSATNTANSGVITALFVSPPTGYITDGNGVMAYKFLPRAESYSDYGTFDIMGFFYNGWKRSTC